MVPDNSTGIPRVPAYSGGAPAGLLFEYGALTRYGPAFQPVLLDNLPSLERSYYPGTRLNAAGLGSSPFARRYWGNRYYFLFLQVLRCFSSLRSPHAIRMMSGSLLTGCPIRKSMDLRVFAPPHGLSQLITSFVASESHRHPPCALSCFLVSFAYMTLLLQVRSILVTSEKVCFNFLGESLYSFCNSSFAFPACQ